MIIMRKPKSLRSYLGITLNADPRPNQPLFSFAILFAILLDVIRLIFSFILHLVAIVCISMLVLLGIIYIKVEPEYKEYMREAKQIVDESTPETFRYNETTMLYDKNNKQMARLEKDGDTVYLKYEDIPEDAVNAFIAVENRTFWEDPGIDWKSMGRVVYDAIRTRGKEVHGASTITQQLARAVFLNNGVTLDRKLKEMAIAIKLTETYSKQDIMEFYVNNVSFANGYYGLEAAAKGYFSKPASELSLSQIAYLCAIPNSPAFYDPYNDETRAIERRDHILESMYDVGFISWSVMQDAKEEKIVINPPHETAGGYAITYASDCAIRYFMKLDGFQFQYHFDTYEEKQAYDEAYHDEYETMRTELYQGGYRIYTSIDTEKQNELQKSVDDFLENTRTEDAKDLQAAIVLCNSQGLVSAIIGGSTDETGYGLNRAYQSDRQPGSCIKPLIVYMPAIQRGYTADTLVKNISIQEALAKEKARIETGTEYKISDMAGEEVTMRYALEQSLNGVAYVLIDATGIWNDLPILENMRFANIVPDDYTLSAALGGFTQGVTPVEMAGAYACLANSGQYNEPTCITSIVNRYGEEMYKKESPTKMFERSQTLTLRDIMEGVMIRGTAKQLKWYDSTDKPAFVKTGTTDSQKDGWLCGWVEDGQETYVMTCWVGCDQPKALNGLWGATWPAQLWKEGMLDILKDSKATEMEMEENIITEEEASADIGSGTETPAEQPAETESIPEVQPQQDSVETNTQEPLPAPAPTPESQEMPVG